MSRDISSSDDMIDVRGVIERFEELESARKPWTAGWNMPGYMPDSDPASFEEWTGARDYLVETLTQNADDAFYMADDVEQGKERSKRYEEAIERLQVLDDGSEFGETVGNYHYFLSALSVRDAFEDESEANEYEAFKSLLDDLRGNGGDEQWRDDWYPGVLIRYDYFTTYTQEIAEDCGDLPRDLPSYIEIDWEATARNLRIDYTAVNFDGVAYLFR